MPDAVDATHYVTLDELQPTVELTARYRFTDDQRYQYRVPGQHFLFVDEGRIDGRSPGGEATARAGEMLCFPAADLNEYAVIAPTVYYEAHIQFARPPRHRHAVWLDGLGPLPLHVRLGDAAPRMRAVFDALCLSLAESGAAHRARVSAAVWQMLALLAEVARPDRRAASAIDAWQRARGRLAAQLEADLPLATVATEADMSVDHFIRGFRRRFGVSPGEFRAQCRLRLAAHRLRAGDEPIKAIARTVGFADADAFTRAFRRYFGITPSDLRDGAPTSTVAGPEEPILPLNRHIVPPVVGPDFYQQFVPRRPR